MQVEISGQHLNISDPIRSHVETRCQRLEKHFRQLLHAHVVLSIEKNRMCAEATVGLRGTQVFAETTHEDMYAAIDELFDKLDCQLNRHKEKHTGQQRARGRDHAKFVEIENSALLGSEGVSIAQILSPDRVVSHRALKSKKSVLEELAELLTSGNESLSPVKVLDCLLQRERIGCTGLGHGVALPHGQMENCREPVAAFIRLSGGTDYDASDQQPVDLIFGMLFPREPASDNLHLQLMAALAQMFRDERLTQRLRHEHAPPRLYRLLVDYPLSSPPADKT